MTEFIRMTNIFKKLNNSSEGKNLIHHLDKFLEYDDANTHLGWEKWLQYEMIYLLSSDGTKLRTPRLEAPFEYDNTIALPKYKSTRKSAKIDLVYDIHGNIKKTNKFHAIELKVKKGIASCFKQGLTDLFRLQAICDDLWDFRSVTGILLFSGQFGNSGNYFDLTNALKSNSNINFEIIPVTDSYTAVFVGWKSRPKQSSRSAYATWCKEITSICEHHHINVWE